MAHFSFIPTSNFKPVTIHLSPEEADVVRKCLENSDRLTTHFVEEMQRQLNEDDTINIFDYCYLSLLHSLEGLPEDIQMVIAEACTYSR